MESASKITRAGDGKMRVDTGNTSVITDPNAQQTIVLDHLKQEARIIPHPPAMPAAPQFAPPAMPGAPAVPGAPAAPPQVKVEDLGKSVIDGHEVEGKKYTFTPPAPPKLPGMPGAPALGQPAVPGMPKPPQAPQVQGPPAAPAMPGMPPMPQAPQAQIPQVPGMPKMPQTPVPPAPPQVPTTTEVWSSTKLNMPVLTKTDGAFGQQTSKCKCAQIPEPDPSKFQVPPGYKVHMPPPAPPKPPDLPKPPQLPKTPKLPG